MLFAGVAGSNGKTTTKEMLTAIMQRQAGRDRVLKTPSNDNNLVGLPKTLLGLKASHRVGVLEVGMNQPGELFKLGKILTPDVALLTNIGTAHCGEFESVDAHFHAKMEWLESMPDHTPVIVNAECQKTKRAVDLIGDRLDFRFVSTASEPSTKSALSARLIEAIPLKSGGYRVVADVNGEQLCFELPVFGRYNIDNALMSAVAGQLLGASRHAIIEALEHFQPVNMRGEIRELAGRTFVIDCYNASPESMNKSLNSFCQMSRDRGMRAFALLGEMAELGDMTNKAHQEVGQAAADLGLTGLFTLGDQMAAAVYEANRGGVSGQSCHSLQEAGYRLMEATRPGDAILLKGSRIMHLEDVLPLIQSMESSSSQQQYV
jgi:UDP-N-acetylmuramoyl-tripeptide--D-alanyl-D-alanine ligase